MKIKAKLILSVFLFSVWTVLLGQEQKLPLEMKSGHLFSDWLVNDSIPTKVMLETGMPIIVISESYALNHLDGLIKLKKAPENAGIRLWGQKEVAKASYLVKDSLQINGNKLFIDALIIDFSKTKSWQNRDIVFPLKNLPGITEINIADKYMKIDKKSDELDSYESFDVGFDENVKGLYLTETLTVCDTLNSKEKLEGNFLFDLGAANALFINRDLEQVEDFLIKSDRMLLKDTTKFKPKPHTKLSIIMPNEFSIGDIFCKGEFIVAMKMFGGNSGKYSGIIGNRFFSHFIVAFDYENNKVYIKSNSKKVIKTRTANNG